MPGESVPQGMWLPPRVATLFVAANNALDRSRAQADFLCDGVADDVQINLALNALPASEGRVILSEGTFNLANPIIIPANNITLEGQGRSTFIDGDGLATGEHGIVISSVADCIVKNLAIQTEDGGGKVCHCIFIEDGSNNCHIEEIVIVNSDSDAIHIEGTTIYDLSIHDVTIEDADVHGIYADMDGANALLRAQITLNTIVGTGSTGIFFGNTGNQNYCTIADNIIYQAGDRAIQLLDTSNSEISGNLCLASIAEGILLGTSNYCGITDNTCYGNGDDGIELSTSIRCIISGNNCYGNASSGIYLDGASEDNIVEGNHCCTSSLDGIRNGGSRNSLNNNICHQNTQHGINTDGVECSINDNYCYQNSYLVAGTYHGINLSSGADRCQINSNFCSGDGTRQEDGIQLEDGANEAQIIGNRCYKGMGSGIALMANNSDCLIKDNYCDVNDDYGIEIVAASCINNVVENNKLLANVTGQILDSGTTTVLPYIFVPVPNPSSSIGTHPAELLTDGIDVMSRFEFYIPNNFTELVRAQVMIVPGGAGNLRRTFTANWGKVCTGENYNNHTDTIAAGQVAVTINDINCIDVSGALDPIAAGDLVGMTFTREASDALDTVDANCYLLGLRLQYV